MPKLAKPMLPPLVLNVPALAGRSEAEVAACLGQPGAGSMDAEPGRTKLSYWGGRVEVVFVQGKAAWIKLYGSRDLPFSVKALYKLGLSVKRPTYVNPGHVISWHNFPRLREVSIYGGGPHGTASSVLVCVRTGGPATAPAHRRWRVSLPGFLALRGT